MKTVLSTSLFDFSCFIAYPLKFLPDQAKLFQWFTYFNLYNLPSKDEYLPICLNIDSLYLIQPLAILFLHSFYKYIINS